MSGQAAEQHVERSTTQAGPDIVVRTAGEADVETAAALFRGYLDFYEVDVQDADAPRAFLAERIAKDESLVLLADVPGAGTVGFAQVYRAFSSLTLTTAWILNDLYVAPSGRRTGAGRALLREVLRRARAAGVAGVQLETAYDNTVAQGLYEAEGFVREEFHVYFHDLSGVTSAEG
ncbi:MULTISPECIES: GNAT family N-acetyltransferase [Streptomyces]|uniref:GNAT family N-acetyltransferase n=1 Tax=Streptomyces TaxID=1883 RepID=UPI0005F89B8C|nr:MULTISPECIES: GNAT family N-acetyltransferase [Streptomyces]KJY22787.1 acetyltransferase [Streptomyces sp. NRRL S-104]KOU44473.1 acetyltransferase [Streptomyces sp. WM6373]KOU79651.1 acetyltransferase [Streptomyces sp. XY66]KOU80261.1 acetyltransferase [Streptomyces sp. XY58]KOV10208.1 acetyltransferase [Streptomyces sp. XY37]